MADAVPGAVAQHRRPQGDPDMCLSVTGPSHCSTKAIVFQCVALDDQDIRLMSRMTNCCPRKSIIVQMICT